MGETRMCQKCQTFSTLPPAYSPSLSLALIHMPIVAILFRIRFDLQTSTHTHKHTKILSSSFFSLSHSPIQYHQPSEKKRGREREIKHRQKVSFSVCPRLEEFQKPDALSHGETYTSVSRSHIRSISFFWALNSYGSYCLSSSLPSVLRHFPLAALLLGFTLFFWKTQTRFFLSCTL